MSRRTERNRGGSRARIAVIAALFAAFTASACASFAQTDAEADVPVDAAFDARRDAPFEVSCPVSRDAGLVCLAGADLRSCVRNAALMAECRGGIYQCPEGSVLESQCGCFTAVAGEECRPSCPGSRTACVMGTIGGACADATMGAACVAGMWTCPPGWVPIGQCACVGAPPHPACTCVSTGWICGDAGLDVPVDGSTVDTASPPDADPRDATCSVAAVRVVPPGMLSVGHYCDELYLCAPTMSAAASVMATSSGFECRFESSTGSLACPAGNYRCEWMPRASGVMITTTVYDAVCAALGVSSGARSGFCVTYI